MYVTTFCVTFLSHHVHTYVLCENRSSIQSLALMHSAISMKVTRHYYSSAPELPNSVTHTLILKLNVLKDVDVINGYHHFGTLV